MMGNVGERTWTIILEGRRSAPGRTSHRSSRSAFAEADPAPGLRSPKLKRAFHQARFLSGLDRSIAVTLRGRGPASTDEARDFPAGRIIEEPRDRGSGCSVFLATTYVLEQDLDATLLFLPSDSAPEPANQLDCYLRSACELAKRHNRLILLGEKPAPWRAPRSWSVPGDTPGSAMAERTAMAAIRPGKTLSGTQALAHHQRGALLNTRILAARAKVLWALGWLRFPDLMRRFEMLLRVLHAIRDGRVPPEDHALALSAIYGDLDHTDFSLDVLTRSLDSLLVLVVDGVAGTGTLRSESSPSHLPARPRRSIESRSGGYAR